MRCTFVQYVRSFLAQYFKIVWYGLSWGCWTYQTISLDFMRYDYRYQLHWFDLIHILNGQFIIITLIRFFFFIRVKWKCERNQQCWEIERERKKKSLRILLRAYAVLSSFFQLFAILELLSNAITSRLFGQNQSYRKKIEKKSFKNVVHTKLMWKLVSWLRRTAPFFLLMMLELSE